MELTGDRRCVQYLLEDAVSEDPDGVALTLLGTQYTRQDLWDLSVRAGGAFEDIGIGGGERVMILLGNRIEFIQAWLGTVLAGGVPAAMNVEFRGLILENLLRTLAPAAIVTQVSLLDNVVPSIEGVGFKGKLIVVDDGDRPVLPGVDVHDFATWVDHEPIAEISRRRPRDVGAIMYSSGTTGPSKGNMWPNEMIVTVIEEWVRSNTYRPGDVVYAAAPLFHGLALLMGCLGSMMAGAQCVLAERFSASAYWEEVARFKATKAMLLGQMATVLLRQELTELERNNTIETAFCAPPPIAYREFEERFGIRITQGYAASEVGMPIMWDPDIEMNPKSIGKPLPDWEVALVDEDDNVVPPGQAGELVARPRRPWVGSLGYFNMPEATVETFRNAWYHSGDLLRCDENGWYYFVDRTDDAMRRGGENISCFEVESVLVSHEDVVEAAAYGVPSDLTEDDVMVALVVGAGADLEAIGDYAEEHLPYYAMPRYFDVREELPKTPNMKLRKAPLREEGITSTTWDRGRLRRDGSRHTS